MAKDDKTEDKGATPVSDSQFSPSQFMRGMRPELYSDTEDRVDYTLTAHDLECHLETITSRNETQKFELFCRKLCERTICPNLRAHTGPDGGGDSKADTETYPVADEIAELFYIGDANASQEKWAFAFSAQKKWTTKVRSDVKGIVETGRDYKKIFFMTSQFARDKKRAEIEDELTKMYDVPVIIHDRAWIVKEVVDNERKDIAHNVFGIGSPNNNPYRMGDGDYSRAKQLEEIEELFSRPDVIKGMEFQFVSEALTAGLLSRCLERPRTETDGRFDRAIRFADRHGTLSQKLEARYEKISTAFWWFDDYQFVQEEYDSFESMVISSDKAEDWDMLNNIFQMLVALVKHGILKKDECKFDGRADVLRRNLSALASVKERPNNALDAETIHLFLRLIIALLHNDEAVLEGIWNDLINVLEKARNLPDYNVYRLRKIVDTAGFFAGNNALYNDLVEKTADFFSERKKETESALMYLNRTKQLGFDDSPVIIRFLGKAINGLAKHDNPEHLCEALNLLSIAYKNSGLMWAARANCAFYASTTLKQAEGENQPPNIFLHALINWAWIALELLHIPDFLMSVYLLNEGLDTFPISESAKKSLCKHLRDMDMVFARLVMNQNDEELEQLGCLPEILDLNRLGLLTSRSAILYSLGHSDVLRKEGTIPQTESDDQVSGLFERLANLRGAERFNGKLILNAEQNQTYYTKILGLNVSIEFFGTDLSIILAETIMASLESFFATSIDAGVVAHTEHFKFIINVGDEGSKESIEVKQMDNLAIISWPADATPTSLEKWNKVHEFHAKIFSCLLSNCYFVADGEKYLKSLEDDEVMIRSMTTASIFSNNYARIYSKPVSRVQDWEKFIENKYDLKENRPTIKIDSSIVGEPSSDSEASSGNVAHRIPKSHKEIITHSIFNDFAWSKAKWWGITYTIDPSSGIPYFAFVFEKQQYAKHIFSYWMERFGQEDLNNEIYISVIRDLPEMNEFDYLVQIASNPFDAGKMASSQLSTVASRNLIMNPPNTASLDKFLEIYSSQQKYYIAPAILEPDKPINLGIDLRILKSALAVKSASDVKEHDIESVALRTLGKHSERNPSDTM